MSEYDIFIFTCKVEAVVISSFLFFVWWRSRTPKIDSTPFKVDSHTDSVIKRFNPPGE